MEKIRSCLLLSPLSRFEGVRPESCTLLCEKFQSRAPGQIFLMITFSGLFLFPARLAVYLMLPFSLFSFPYGPTIMYLVNLVFSKCFIAFWCNLSVGHWSPVSSRTERQDASQVSSAGSLWASGIASGDPRHRHGGHVIHQRRGEGGCDGCVCFLSV